MNEVIINKHKQEVITIESLSGEVTNEHTEYSNMPLDELSNLFKKATNNNNSQEAFKLSEAINLKMIEMSSEGVLINYIKTHKIDELSLKAASKLVKKPEHVTEDWIYTLLMERKIPEEKALYALTIQKIASVFSQYKNSNNELTQKVDELHSSVSKMSKQLDELTSEDSQKNVAILNESKTKQLENEIIDLKTTIKELTLTKEALEKNYKDEIDELREQTKESSAEIENGEIVRLLAEKLNSSIDDINPVTIDNVLSRYINANSNDTNKELIIQKLNDKVTDLEQQNGNLLLEIDSARVPSETTENKDTSTTEDMAREEIEGTEKMAIKAKKSPITKAVIIILSIIVLIAISSALLWIALPSEGKKTLMPFLQSNMSEEENNDELLVGVESIDLDRLETNSNGVADTKKEKIFEPANSYTTAASSNIFEDVKAQQETSINKSSISQTPSSTINPSQKEALLSSSSDFSVTPNRKISFGNREYSKYDKIFGFKIMFISSDFLLFKDNNTSDIFKIIIKK